MGTATMGTFAQLRRSLRKSSGWQGGTGTASHGGGDGQRAACLHLIDRAPGHSGAGGARPGHWERWTFPSSSPAGVDKGAGDLGCWRVPLNTLQMVSCNV